MKLLKQPIPPPENLTATTVEFGEWLPDLMALNNPGATEALNVIPSGSGYAPFRDIALVEGLGLPEACKGAIVLADRLLNVKLYAGTMKGLYLREGAEFVTQYTTTSIIDGDLLWQFIPFGDNFVAVHLQNTPQVTSLSASSPFANLGGSPPNAMCGGRVGDFLVLGNLDNETDPAGPRQPQRIRWNGFGTVDQPWVTDPTTQADFNDMPPEGGQVMGIVGRDVGTVFQENMISRMVEVGLPTVFNIETVETVRGALCPGGIVNAVSSVGYGATQIYFLAQDGFFVWNGLSSQSISDNKVAKYFFSRFDFSARGLVVGSLDLANSCVWWAFPTHGVREDTSIVTESGLDLETEDGQGLLIEDDAAIPLTEAMIYSYKDQRWSHAFIKAEYIFLSPVANLPASIDSLTGDLDTDYVTSFDSVDSFDAGSVVVAGFDETHSFGAYNGQILAATLDTATATGPNGTRVFTTSARPLTDLTLPIATVQTITQDQVVGEAPVFGDITPQEVNGECSIMSDARYMRFRVQIPAGAAWAHATAIEIWRRTTGRV